MPKLYQLPDESWIAADQVAGVDAVEFHGPLEVPAVVMRTKDGRELVFLHEQLGHATAARDEMAREINAILAEG